jgi:hypothetical protein
MRRQRRIHTKEPILFHTNVRPQDAFGQKLQPFDFVIIGKIPEPNYMDPDFASLKEYEGCYGMVVYSGDTPYNFGDKNHLGWISPDGQYVCVISRRVEMDTLLAWDFWLPASTLRKIPFNYPLAAAFASYRLFLEDNELGPEFMIVEGTEPFEKIKAVLQAPYNTLVKAHHEIAKLLAVT